MIQAADIKLYPSNFGGPCEPEQQSGLADQTRDSRIQTGVWESGPGTLELHFPWTESVFILEGRAEVENLDTKESFVLTPGTLALFESGSHWSWRIPWKLKKIFTLVEAENENATEHTSS